MSAQLLQGKRLAQRLRAELAEAVAQNHARTGRRPCIACVVIGNDADALGYARTQKRACQRVGIDYVLRNLPRDIRPAAAAAQLDALRQDASVSGLILLTPLPEHLRDARLNWHIAPDKDIDGVHPNNLGRLAANGMPFFTPATPAAGLALLQETGLELEGKRAVIIGRSDTVGKPLAFHLLHRHCTVTLAHSRTRNLPAIAAQADLLCVAVGRPQMVTGAFVKPGAAVLDFGTTYLESGVTGDCHPESVIPKAGWFTPVPGGIGPLTNAMLMRNAWRAYVQQAQ